MTLLQSTHAILPTEINSANDLLAYHIYAILVRAHGKHQVQFDGVSQDGESESDNEQDDAICHAISVNEPPKEIRVVSLGGISRSVVCVDHSADDDIRTQVLSLDKYLNVGAFPVKRSAIHRAFRSHDESLQESKLALMGSDLEAVLFSGGVDSAGGLGGVASAESGGSAGKTENTSNTLNASSTWNSSTATPSQRSSQITADTTHMAHPAQPPHPAPNTHPLNIGSGDLDPFQSYTHPPGSSGAFPGAQGMYPTRESFQSFQSSIPPGARYDPVAPVFGPGGGVGVGRGTGSTGTPNHPRNPPFSHSFPPNPDFDEPMPPGSVSFSL